jgi:hypothetical protein
MTVEFDADHRAATPTNKWSGCPNLQRRPHAPAKGRGRIQRQIARAFMAHGEIVSSSDIYRWCRGRQRWFGRPQRWSVRRVLDVVAVRVGRQPTFPRAWLWRLRNTDEKPG